ncbi:MAG: YncE family protein [Opitutaceae bacterium]
MRIRGWATVIVFFLGVVAAARAQLAVAATDNRLVLADGVERLRAHPAPDTFVVLDLNGPAPRKLAEVTGVPASVVGPPFSVALTPDGTLALDTSCMKADPADPSKQVFDDRITVIDLSNPQAPSVIAILHSGPGPAGVAINRRGNLALVADRGDGSVAVFSIFGHMVIPAGKLQVGNAASALGEVAFCPGGRRALVTRTGDGIITVLKVDGDRVTLAGRDVRAGQRPYGVDVSGDGRFAVVASDGGGPRGDGTVSVIDLAHGPARTVETRTVGRASAGIALSPDGSLCAVVAENGGNVAHVPPFSPPQGMLVLFLVRGERLKRVAEAPTGPWPQGVVFSRDGHWIVVCNRSEKDLQPFSWDGSRLAETLRPIGLGGGPVAIRTADP